MIVTQGRRAPHAANPAYHEAPNAALLIDFDNVTMGIRSDLGKELKALLNSDVIKGKVSVQRAYADWRRYPQYIVPLAESSIDLIFAPAYGSSKKNATDLRMAIDAIELVFTRPEIGTFILLTGDSDFSSCVLKLKEYGKYVIGVGMRESSSDLLIQNCDEYYSYHSLSGLTRTEEIGVSREDPWELARRAAQQMVADRDVMRTDRLKQVMLSLDPGFDEKKLGYSKFSRFVQEGATKGLFRLKKLDNGQFEISPTDGEEPSAAPAERERGEAARPRRTTDGRRRRGPAPVEMPAPEAAPAAAPVAPAAQPAPAPAAAGTDLQSAYALLQQALQALAGKNGKWVRDGDVKRKMLEFAPDFDETKLGFSKFSRFLRQAHDAEVIDLNRVGTGHYEVALSARAGRIAPPAAPVAPAEAVAAPAAPPARQAREARPAEPAAAAAVGGGLRARRTRRGMAPEGPPPILPGQVIRPPTVPAPQAAPAAPAEAAPVEVVPAAVEPEIEAAAAAAAASATVEVQEPAAAPARRRGRGRRGAAARGADAAPPALLPGQVVSTAAAPAAEEAPPTESPELPVQPAAEAAAEAPKKTRGRSRTRKAAAAAAPEPVPEPMFSAAALGLPRGANAITAYLSNSYRGIGKKTAESLLGAFGDDLFRVMHEEPARVQEVLGDRRANTLLEQWAADYARRTEAAAPAPEAQAPAAVEASEPETAAASAEQDEKEPRRARSRSRRGGRGRSRKKQEEPASA